MTDKLRAAAEMALEALEFSQQMGRSYEIPEYHNEIAPKAMYALRQALAEPDMGIDRGAWSDVPDATKWVDDLRGDEDLEEPPNSTTDVVEFVCFLRETQWSYEIAPWNDRNAFPVYAAPPKPDLLNQTCCECGRSGGYALYCVECWNKASQWQGLTVDEILATKFAARHIDTEFVTTTRNDLIQFAREIETMLREKNG